jgi:arginyl-tRNA synthetase
MLRKEISNLIEKAMRKMQEQGIFPDFFVSEILITKSEGKNHGDYSTNIAMIICRSGITRILTRKDTEKLTPIKVADILVVELKNYKESRDLFEKIEIVKPGFINFFLSEKYLQKQVIEILQKQEGFGNLKIGKSKKVNLEFISANPTGPLTLGNGRGGFCGDVLTNVLKKAGHKVVKEYYINDTGEQVKKLGHSMIGDSEAVYGGDYISDLRKRIGPAKGGEPEKVGENAAKIILKEIIKPTIKKMGIKFDVWFSEKKKLYQKKEIDKILEQLKSKNLVYENEGALWFKSTNFGDDKDRVLIKADDQTTYFTSDIAYLKNKFKRSFNDLIFFWGADHYGYVARLKAAAEALGYKKEQLHIIVMQLVRLVEGGKEARMSKRSGVFITLDELIDEVGLDVSRFFFLTKNYDTHLNFDLDLAKEQSEKNPVYYCQYAYARICSILRKTQANFQFSIFNFQLLKHPLELDLIKQLIRLPEIIEDIACDYRVQRLPQYALDLATSLHQFYRDCRVLTGSRSLSEARLALVLATKIVLKNVLDLMGISAPQKM